MNIKKDFQMRIRSFGLIVYVILLAILHSCGGSTKIEIQQVKQVITDVHNTKLNWGTPSKNTDNSNVNGDVTGFRIYYGVSSGNYTSYIEVGNVNSYSLDVPLDGNTYYFAVTAVNSSGQESDFSAEVNTGN